MSILLHKNFKKICWLKEKDTENHVSLFSPHLFYIARCIFVITKSILANARKGFIATQNPKSMAE